MTVTLDHIGIAVENLTSALPFWSEVLDLRVAGIETVDTEGVKVAFLPAGDARLELLEATARQIDPARDWRALLAEMMADHPSAGELMETYAAELQRARQFLIDHAIVPIPDEKLQLRETPPFMRSTVPFAAYDALNFRVPVFTTGDVKARTLVRLEEARESVGLIRQAITGLPAGPLQAPIGRLPAYEPAWSFVEGWRGAIIHWVMAGADGNSRAHIFCRRVEAELIAIDGYYRMADEMDAYLGKPIHAWLEDGTLAIKTLD